MDQKTSQYLVTIICLMQHDTSPSHRIDQADDCGLWNVVPLLAKGCAMFLDIGIFSASCVMGPCIIMLKHEAMVADEWYDNRPQDLVTLFLCYQIAIDKMQLCLLSIAYNCPYHNPTATMGHSVHNVDISKPLAHMSAICPVQLKPGFICEEHTSTAFSGKHSSSHHANCTLPQLETSVALCCVTKLHISEWPFLSPAQGAPL